MCVRDAQTQTRALGETEYVTGIVFSRTSDSSILTRSIPTTVDTFSGQLNEEDPEQA